MTTATNKHPDLYCIDVDLSHIAGPDLECYFHKYDGELWHAYVGDVDIAEIMDELSRGACEREYRAARREEQAWAALDAALEREVY